MQGMEHENGPEGAGKGELDLETWRRNVHVGDRVVEAVLQLQHRRDLGARWRAERDMQLQTGKALWMEQGWSGRYRVAAGRRWWLGCHMT